MTDFIAVAEQELKAVENELAKSPLYQKAEYLRGLLALYRGAEAMPTAPVSTPQAKSPFAPTTEPKRINRPVNPDREMALMMAAEAIRDRYTPTKTSDIYEIIEPRGAKIGGTDPRSNLSAMLHHSPVFRSHGRKGWTLAEYNVSEENDPSRDLDLENPETETHLLDVI